MCLADSSRKGMSRCGILELLSEALFGLTRSQLAKPSGQERRSTRSSRASLATRLWQVGLVRCDLDKLFRPARLDSDFIAGE
jgi:hypothetical protein